MKWLDPGKLCKGKEAFHQKVHFPGQQSHQQEILSDTNATQNARKQETMQDQLNF